MMFKFNPIFKELLNRSKLAIDKDGSEAFDSLISIHQYARLYRTTLKYVSAGTQTLDWGAGGGHFSYFLQQSGYTVSSYSFNYPYVIDPEISLGQVTYHKADPKCPVILPFGAEQYDAVFSVGVLEHVTEFKGNEVGSLREIARILKPSGVFICFHFPNHCSWIEYLARKLGRYHHINTYTRLQIEQLFEVDFEIVKIQRYAALPRNILGKLPEWLSNNFFAISVFNLTDQVLAKLLPWICQNWIIVARKKLEAQVK